MLYALLHHHAAAHWTLLSFNCMYTLKGHSLDFHLSHLIKNIYRYCLVLSKVESDLHVNRAVYTPSSAAAAGQIQICGLLNFLTAHTLTALDLTYKKQKKHLCLLNKNRLHVSVTMWEKCRK